MMTVAQAAEKWKVSPRRVSPNGLKTDGFPVRSAGDESDVPIRRMPAVKAERKERRDYR